MSRTAASLAPIQSACRKASPGRSRKRSRTPAAAPGSGDVAWVAGPVTSIATVPTVVRRTRLDLDPYHDRAHVAVDRDVDRGVVEAFDRGDAPRLRRCVAHEALQQVGRHLLVGLPADEVESLAQRGGGRIRSVDDERVGHVVRHGGCRGRRSRRILRDRGGGAEGQHEGDRGGEGSARYGGRGAPPLCCRDYRGGSFTRPRMLQRRPVGGLVVTPPDRPRILEQLPRRAVAVRNELGAHRRQARQRRRRPVSRRRGVLGTEEGHRRVAARHPEAVVQRCSAAAEQRERRRGRRAIGVSAWR